MVRASRRRFSLLLACGLGLCAAPLLGSASRGGASSPDALKRLLDATLSDPAGARAIGRRFLASGPDVAGDVQALAARLMAARPASATDLRRLLAGYRDDDRRRRALVLVDGWMLPRLEAQICALTVLL